MNFLILDVGGANLVVEINQQSASYRPDRSGTSKERAYSGKPLVTRTYDDKGTWSFETKPLTTTEMRAVLAAAQYPEAIDVGGEFPRLDNANTTPQTITATVLTEEVPYFGVKDDFLHVVRLTIEEE